jgi:tetratricopeptide (TPR) repeat protein
MVEYLKALRIARADFELKERILDPKDTDFLLSRYHVGADLDLIGRYRESAEWLEHLIKDMPENIHYAIYLPAAVSLGGSYSRLEEYRSSFDLCTKTMAKFEDIFAGESFEPVPLYNAMAEALCGLKRPKEALIWSTKAVLGAQKVFGAEHLRTVVATGYLAYVYADLKDFQRACELQEKCVNFLKDSLGTDHPTTIDYEETLIGYIAQRRMNRLSRRRFIGRRKALLDKMNQQFGEKDWRTLDCQSRLARDYFANGSFKKAKLMQEKWVETMIQEFGQDDKRTIGGMAALAWTNNWILIRKAVYWWLPQCFVK